MLIKNIGWIFLLLIFCIPLLWLNVNYSHDWGDDFASYLHQAKNICEGKPQSDIGYIYNPRFAFMGPPAYTVGFPLLLAPVYAISGLNIHTYLIFMSTLLILFLVVMFLLLNTKMKSLYAFLFCLMIAYNPSTLMIKGEIMCDICFSFFLLLLFILYEQWKKKSVLAYPVLLALLNGWLLSLKASGVVFSLALLIMLMVLFIRQRSTLFKQNIWRNNLIITFGGLTIYFLLNEILFPIPHSGVSFYMSIAKAENYLDTMLSNLNYYVMLFNSFFTPEMEQWNAIAKITSAVMLSLAFTGFLLRVRKQFDLADTIFILYIFLILLYPYQGGGVRFIFPVIPFVCYYVYLSVQLLTRNIYSKNLLALTISIIVLLQYSTWIEKNIETRSQIIEGPQTVFGQQAFEFIKSETPTNSIFIFRRPRALALYTSRRACCNFVWDAPQDALQNMDSLGVNYCMTNQNDANPALDSLIKNKPEFFKKLWSNEQFTIYRFRLKPSHSKKYSFNGPVSCNQCNSN